MKMEKTRLLLVCLLLLCVSTIQAQSKQSQWCVTPRVGMNSSDVRGMRGVDTSRKWGVTAGFDVEGMVTKRFGVSAGAFFSDEGFRGKGNNVESVHLRFISVPVLANCYVLPGLAVKGGVQMSGLIDGQRHFGGNTEGVLNKTKTFGVSIPVGLSYDFRNLSLDVRYLFGVTDFCDSPSKSDVGAHWHTNSIWLTAGWRFNLFE